MAIGRYAAFQPICRTAALKYGPVERKMVINALNANVKVFMADLVISAGLEQSDRRADQPA